MDKADNVNCMEITAHNIRKWHQIIYIYLVVVYNQTPKSYAINTIMF